MSNTEYMFCPHCNKNTFFTIQDFDTWECLQCGWSADDDEEDELLGGF